MSRIGGAACVPWWLAALAACAGAPAIAPGAAPDPPAMVRDDGTLGGAALGFALGSEAHVFVADSAFTTRVFDRLLRPALDSAGSRSLATAIGGRGVLAVAAERLAAAGYGSDMLDATVVHENGAIPARLALVRLHRPGHCTVPGYVTELVLEFPQTERRAAPRPQRPVLALWRRTAGAAHHALRAPSRRPGADTAHRLLSLAALSAESLLARAGRLPPGAPLPVPLALEPDRAADAGEVLTLPEDPGRTAIGLRVRFLTETRDTVLVSGVALADVRSERLTWVVAPVRRPLARGLATTGGRYSLRGVLAGPPLLLLVDEVADVAAVESRTLAIDPRTRRLVAARPLALRCP